MPVSSLRAFPCFQKKNETPRLSAYEAMLFLRLLFKALPPHRTEQTSYRICIRAPRQRGAAGGYCCKRPFEKSLEANESYGRPSAE